MCAYFLQAFLGKSFQQLFYICHVNGLAQVRLNRLLGYLCWVSLSCPGRQVIPELNELCEASWLYVKRRENKSFLLYSPLARTFHNCTGIFFSVGQKRADTTEYPSCKLVIRQFVKSTVDILLNLQSFIREVEWDARSLISCGAKKVMWFYIYYQKKSPLN